MSERAHTKGPWSVVERRDALDNLSGLDIEAERGGTICLLQGHWLKQRANAPLIAAAPELLEACRAIVAAGRTDNEGGFSVSAVAGREACKKALAAIAKAEKGAGQ